MEVRFSLDRVTLQPGDEMDSLDFGGSTETLSIQVGSDIDLDTLETDVASEPGAPSDLSARAVGTEPAVFLVGRVAEAA
jgi:hypothetical protein